LADNEENHLIPDEESEAERTKRNAIQRTAVSRFNAELRQQVGDDV